MSNFLHKHCKLNKYNVYVEYTSIYYFIEIYVDKIQYKLLNGLNLIQGYYLH